MPEDSEKKESPSFFSIEEDVLKLKPELIATHPEAQPHDGGRAIELILQAWDDGTPALCTTERVLIEIEPQTEGSSDQQSLASEPGLELSGSAEPYSDTTLFHVTAEDVLLF